MHVKDSPEYIEMMTGLIHSLSDPDDIPDSFKYSDRGVKDAIRAMLMHRDSEGNLEAVQAGNEALGQMSRHMLHLLQMTGSQGRAQVSEIAQQIATEKAQAAQHMKLYENWGTRTKATNIQTSW